MDVSWKLQIHQFIDDVRQNLDAARVEPGFTRGDPRLRALAAATVEALAAERGQDAAPPWAVNVPPLAHPWFVSGIENLKAAALVESPVYFRRRNIFVLGNFLARA